jgi:hypothetical protein
MEFYYKCVRFQSENKKFRLRSFWGKNTKVQKNSTFASHNPLPELEGLQKGL